MIRLSGSVKLRWALSLFKNLLTDRLAHFHEYLLGWLIAAFNKDGNFTEVDSLALTECLQRIEHTGPGCFRI